jgi:protein involved in polysaccharide export with SLBB domain
MRKRALSVSDNGLADFVFTARCLFSWSLRGLEHIASKWTCDSALTYCKLDKLFVKSIQALMTLALVVLAGFVALSPNAARPQSVPPGFVQQLQSQFGRGGDVVNQGSPLDQSRAAPPPVLDKQTSTLSPQDEPEPLTPLEFDYSQRAETPLRQFGYNIFSKRSATLGGPIGRIGDDYVLDVGDQLVITFRGDLRETVIAPLDRNGQLTIDVLRPLPAAGRTLGDVRSHIQQEVQQTLLGTEVFVTLGGLRNITVGVFGQVQSPGLIPLGSVSSVIDALAAAEGIAKTGSLRSVRLVRDGQTRRLDLYRLLLGIDSYGNLRLQHGDQILVPDIGATVAVTGLVKRPGVFELSTHGGALSITEAISLAGGAIRPGVARIVVRRGGGVRGTEQLIEVVAPEQVVAGDGDLIIVDAGEVRPLGTAELLGHVRQPGLRPLSLVPTLARLINGDAGLLPGAYYPFAIFQTYDPQIGGPQYYPIDLRAVINGSLDVQLREDDRFFVLSHDDVHYLSTADIEAVLNERVPPSVRLAEELAVDLLSESAQLRSTPSELRNISRETLRQIAPDAEDAVRRDPSLLFADDLRLDGESDENVSGLIFRAPGDLLVQTGAVCRGLASLARQIRIEGNDRFTMPRLQLGEIGADGARRVLPPVSDLDIRDSIIEDIRPCPDIFAEHPQTLPFAMEHVAGVGGAVRRPGLFPIAASINLFDALTLGGGLMGTAAADAVEVTSAAETAVAALAVNLADPNAGAVQVGPGTVIRVGRIPTGRVDGSIQLIGAFVQPGRYTILPGDRLSDVIARAGGLTNQAYPYGAIFTRVSVQRAEQLANQRSARELRSALAAAVAQADGVELGQALPALGQLIDELTTAPVLGRVVVQADPTVLEVEPSLDLLIRSGDRLFIPERPASVTVAGEVLNPSTVKFRSGLRARDYIDLVGSFAVSADRGRTYVVFPDGTAQRVRDGLWRRDPTPIPPGSIILVPRDPRPFDAVGIVQDVAQLSSQLAVTAAALASVTRK